MSSNPYSLTKLLEYQIPVLRDTCRNLINHGFHGEFLPMGGGKTKITISAKEFLYSLNLIQGIIIHTKKSLLPVWLQEFKKHTSLPLRFFKWDSVRDRTKKYQKEKKAFLECLSGLPVFLLNIESFSCTKKQLLKKSFYTMYKQFISEKIVIHVLDESSCIKNWEANRTQHLIGATSTQSKTYKMILTGTEITTSILNIYTQMEFLKPGFWGMNWYQFQSRYAIFEKRYFGKSCIDKRTGEVKKIASKVIVGFRRINEIQDKIAPYISRLTEDECIKLPPKVEMTIDIEMTSTQKKLYAELKRDKIAEYEGELITSQHMIVIFNYLRMICGGFHPVTKEPLKGGNPKLDFIVDDSAEYEGKVVIWCAFIHEIDFLYEKLKKLGAIRYHSKCSEDGLIEFEENPEIKYGVLSLQKAAHGKNLQFSALSYTFSPHSSPEISWQAGKRQRRIGQRLIVTDKRLVCPGTADERVYTTLHNKGTMAEMFKNGSLKPDEVFKLL